MTGSLVTVVEQGAAGLFMREEARHLMMSENLHTTVNSLSKSLR